MVVLADTLPQSITKFEKLENEIKSSQKFKRHIKRNLVFNSTLKLRHILSDINTATYTSDKFLIPLLKHIEHS